MRIRDPALSGDLLRRFGVSVSGLKDVIRCFDKFAL